MWSSPTSRKARAGFATSTPCSGSANTISTSDSGAGLVDKGVLSKAGIAHVRARRGFPLGGPLQPAFPDQARRREADLRTPARSGRAHGLCRPAGHARRRALHEALFPGRQGCRRSDPHLLRLDRGLAGRQVRHGRPRARELDRRPAQEDQGRDGFLHRPRPAQHRRPRCVRQGPGQPHQDLLGGLARGTAVPPRRAQADHALAAADQRRRCATTRRPTAISATS